MKYKITLSYDGTGFCGWQSQPNGKSVQDALESAILRLTGESVRATGSGRTDAGVHALAQVASFECKKELAPINITGGLNAYLPPAVRVLSAEIAPPDFDARKSAKKKTYMYVFYTGERLPLLNDRVAFTGELDETKMSDGAKLFIGTKDFATFRASGGGAKTTTRTVFDARIVRSGDFVRLYITADGFLYNMVRIIAAQLIKLGKGETVDIAELIEKRDRSYAKEIAPAGGLYLYSVEYGDK